MSRTGPWLIKMIYLKNNSVTLQGSTLEMATSDDDDTHIYLQLPTRSKPVQFPYLENNDEVIRQSCCAYSKKNPATSVMFVLCQKDCCISHQHENINENLVGIELKASSTGLFRVILCHISHLKTLIRD